MYKYQCHYVHNTGLLTGLRELWLSNNRLQGRIPRELGRLTRMESLSLSSNNLSGKLPLSLAGLGRLEGLSLLGNPKFVPVDLTFQHGDDVQVCVCVCVCTGVMVPMPMQCQCRCQCQSFCFYVCELQGFLGALRERRKQDIAYWQQYQLDRD